ncbi:DNA translocase FtsK [Ligilactobacillus ceti]|uniref:DNA translocase FtsK n=1 Tax=Ligilactobacillus ceti DSM 22408 TaxID=1122146 RepID=A0A0R2KRY5_9LACO|nr:DNA translocase FtsK [Ligilactobacillus ceti]KRN89063.1 cell division protein [Ligilactobacillus ceti DSM 22408]
MAKKRKSRTRKRKKTEISERIIGFVFIILSILGFFKLGYLGITIRNVFRFFIGDVAPIGLILLCLSGLILLITGKEPKIKKQYWIGFGLTLLGLDLLLEAILFNKLNLHTNFISITWQYLRQDILNNSLGTAVGGGMIGAFLYSGTYFLVSQIGTYIISGILLFFGCCAFWKITPQQSLEFIGQQLYKVTKGVQSTSKKAKNFSQQKYQEHQELQAEKAQAEREAALMAQIEQEKPVLKTQQEPVEINEQPKVTQNVWNEPVEKPVQQQIELVEQGKKDLPKPKSIVQNDGEYELPSLALLEDVAPTDQSDEQRLIRQNEAILQQTFASFGVDVELVNTILGPAVTKYELHPAIGVKVSKIVNLTDDLALALAAKDIRIEAPIPGKSLIGIEVPNTKTAMISFKNIMLEQKEKEHAPLEVPLGRDVSGKLISADLGKMPHLLIAGSTGSGKSVAINSIITSLLMNQPPENVKMILVDPKKVELGVYNDIPHLLTPVVTDPKKAARALNKLVQEMERRYEIFANTGQRKIETYNQMVAQDPMSGEKLPYIVAILDELSDLMMVASNEVEDAIIRIAQMGRAAGIHLILATQRPSVDVITGIIKANVPSRMAFAVSSNTDSRTIIDQAGAEKLLGRGDMLFLPMGMNKPIRVQGAFVSDRDVQNVVEHVKTQRGAQYDAELTVTDDELAAEMQKEEEDPLFAEALEFIKQEQKCSISLLQRRFKIGYNRSARMVEEMENRGYIGPSEGSKPRKVYLPKA